MTSVKLINHSSSTADWNNLLAISFSRYSLSGQSNVGWFLSKSQYWGATDTPRLIYLVLRSFVMRILKGNSLFLRGLYLKHTTSIVVLMGKTLGKTNPVFRPFYTKKKESRISATLWLSSGTTRNRTMRSSVCISLNWISAKGTVSRGCSTEKPHHFAGFHGVDFLLRCKDNLLFWKVSRCLPILLHLEKESNNFSCFLTASYGCCSPFGASKSSWDRCIQSLFPVKLLEILLSHSATGWDRGCYAAAAPKPSRRCGSVLVLFIPISSWTAVIYKFNWGH